MSRIFVWLNIELYKSGWLMSEYLVIAVAYAEEDEHIDWLLITRRIDGKLNRVWVADRNWVADLITTKSASFKTAVKNPTTKKFEPGADIHVYEDAFLSTDPNALERDNLANLPRFTSPQLDIDLKEMFA